MAQFPEALGLLPAKVVEEVPGVPCYEEMQHLVAVGEKKRYGHSDLAWPRAVAIDYKTNKIYVTEHLYRISIFSESGEFLNSFSHDSWDPYGIAVHLDNVFVTDIRGHFILHFRESEKFHLVAKKGGIGSEIGKFNKPRQLTVSNNFDIFVADSYNDRVQILNSDLDYQRHISHHSMTRPCDMKLTPKEVYVLSFEDSPCLHVFSYDGDKLRSLLTEAQVYQSYLFCLDAKENIIICDDRIKVFSKGGTLLHELGKQGSEVGMFDYPRFGFICGNMARNPSALRTLYRTCGIAITSSLKLVVVSSNEKCALQIFSY